MKKYPNSSDRRVFGALGAPRRRLETPQPSSSRNSVISARFPQVSPRIGSGDVEEDLRSPRPYGLSIPPDMFSSLVDGWTEHPASDPIVEDDLSTRELKNKRRKLNQEEGDALDKLEIPPSQYSNRNDMLDDLHEDGVSCSSKSATKSSVPPAGLTSDDSRPILPLQNDVASPRLGNSIPMCTNAFSKYADANRARWRRRKEHWASCSANDWLSGGEGIFDMLACILDRIQQGVEADIQSIDILGHSLDNHSGGILQNREDMLGTAKDALRRNDGFMSNNHATSETAN
ncbi:hypothetical protein FRC15_011901 [Serendipita sp. 397]|nr:hypothetical protein FRC15_011901 [Serendipita sp. 397]